ncbi:MAG: ATP-dependent DNA helicase, partial [Wenzhouxiangellaceae bacterium]|nr:ATP-dependent DNA helicase [Wenzhouxiangellaceae bacterium]
ARADSSGLHIQAGDMLAESRQLLGALPSPERLVIERFFDPGGDRHIVLHTFAGARINRAWGLALRKRFCRRFNFELQAAATDDGILISLGVTSLFELPEVAGFVRSHNVGDVLTQALLDTPLFVTRFRWCANNALILLKNDRTGRVHPQRQRSQAENLVACVFPDQLACLENLSGPREVPDHPLVRQALDDCLHEHMDLDGLKTLLARIETGALAVHAVDTERPSPLSQALIHAPRHSYLDEAAAEERRTRSFEQPAMRSRPRQSVKAPAAAPSFSAPTGQQLLQPAGRQPGPDNLERLLLESGFLTAAEGETGLGLAGPLPAGGWSRHFSTLVREKRALKISTATGTQQSLWIAAERLGWFLELAPDLEYSPWISAALVREPPGGAEGVRQWLVAGRARIDGDGAEKAVARLLGLKPVAA